MNKAVGGHFSLKGFMQQVSLLRYPEVVRQCETILGHMDKKISEKVKADDVWSSLRLRAFFFFLTTGKFLSSGKPDAPLYRPVIAALVEKGELSPKYLDAVDYEIEAACDKPMAQTPLRKLMVPESAGAE
jgi:hypothetical protein